MKRRGFLEAAMAFLGMPNITAERFDISVSKPNEFQSSGIIQRDPVVSDIDDPSPHIGGRSLSQMTTGSQNICIGYKSLQTKGTLGACENSK